MFEFFNNMLELLCEKFNGLNFLYYSFAVVFFFLGIQKILPGSSPVASDVGSFISIIDPSLTVNSSHSYFIGLYEMFLGILFYYRKLDLATPFFIAHQLIAFSVFVVSPGLTFSVPYYNILGFDIPYILSYFGAFITKNIIFVGAFVKLFDESRNSNVNQVQPSKLRKFIGFIIISVFIIGIVTSLRYSEGLHPSDLESKVEEPIIEFNQSNGYSLDYKVTKPHERRVAFGGGVYISNVDRHGSEEILLTGGEDVRLFDIKESRIDSVDEFPDFPFKNILSAHFVDLNQNGFEDLILFPSESDPIVLENNYGKFSYHGVIDGLKLNNPLGAASGDISGNGCLDIFVYQAMNESLTEGDENYLLENEGCSLNFDGDDAEVLGSSFEPSVTHAVSIYDFDNNGKPDIHVANDFTNDVIHFNQGSRFNSKKLGEATNRNAMGSNIVDLNRDNRPEIFISNIKKNNLLSIKNRTVKDSANELGLISNSWGWASVIQDLNNDGNKEVFHTNSGDFGSEKPPLWVRKNESFERYRYHNIKPKSGAGVVSIDIDGDGFLDLIRTPRYLDEDERIINSRYSEKNIKIEIDNQSSHNNPEVILNQLDNGNYLDLKLLSNNSYAIGAKATLFYGNKSRTKFLTSGSGYMSQKPRELHFGLGKEEKLNKLKVEWPDGNIDFIRNLYLNQTNVISR